jgi:hypothetical protein
MAHQLCAEVRGVQLQAAQLHRATAKLHIQLRARRRGQNPSAHSELPRPHSLTTKT